MSAWQSLHLSILSCISFKEICRFFKKFLFELSKKNANLVADFSQIHGKKLNL